MTSDCRTGKTTSLMSCRADSGSACFWPPSLRHVLISLSLMEPVSAMDPDGARSLYALVDRIHKAHGMTVVVVEHDLNYLLPYMTHMVLMETGKIKVQGPFEEAARRAFPQESLRANPP